MTLAASQQVIGFSDRSNYFVPDTTRPKAASGFATEPLYIRFMEEEIQFRTATIAPDMRIMKARATAWLRRQDRYENAPDFWVDVTACGLVSFTRSFFAAYQGFRNAPQSAPF
ncbi:hypothetical protein LGM58_20225 [Burkholderia contaminans]|uniref:hypothetical protein n=1 Tax=Burkholderia contaminans TaxID=488447 RepID=UPI001CF5BCA4|nr:hypothetical protein [Burkholderia contaminans]MCA7885513.1 hypothetical protein [Burkholderia contaminans]HDR9127195.1 hypothetical protein [Burkholderia vietnamiensis]